MGKTSVKLFKDLKAVVYQKKSDVPNAKVIYKVFRSVKRSAGLRYDITVLFPLMLGRECSKTFGHYHQNNEPELYEILKGEAIFIFQKPSRNPLKIKEVYAVLAQEKDKVIAPMGFGMTMINPTSKNLKVGNWIKDEVKNAYENYLITKGAAYYCLKDENNWIRFIPNKNYQAVPNIKFLEPRAMPKILKNKKFLLASQKYQRYLTIKNLFKEIS